MLDQLRERIWYLHYSLSTEKAYLHWVRIFVRWHERDGEMRHPRDIGAAEIETHQALPCHGSLEHTQGQRMCGIHPTRQAQQQ